MLLKKIDDYRKNGFEISIEASGSEDEESYYCNLYYGDSNSPWKPGSLVGIGYGSSMEECFENAILDLKHPTNGKDY